MYICIQGRWGRGLCGPRTPGTRSIAPGPLPANKKTFFPSSFRTKLWETEREPTGAMKTKKRADERMHSLTASFLSFSPDAKHPVGGETPPARGRPCRSQFTKLQLLMCKRASTCYIASPGNRLYDKIAVSGEWVQGQCPCWGGGAKPPMVSLNRHISPAFLFYGCRCLE